MYVITNPLFRGIHWQYRRAKHERYKDQSARRHFVVCASRQLSFCRDRRTKKKSYAAEGYGFLRDAVAARYARLGAAVDADEIFISDGAKTDLALIPQLFGECTVYLTDPTYPAYRDVNISLGNRIEYLAANEENGFLPMPDARHGTGVLRHGSRTRAPQVR